MPTGIYKRTKPNHWIGRKHTQETIKKMREAKRGKRPNNWKGGIIKHNGYWYILKHNHPNANRVGYVKRANLVMEKHLGRYLTKKEVVHHIGAKDDDRSKMLYLFSSINEHQSYEVNLQNTYRRWNLQSRRA